MVFAMNHAEADGVTGRMCEFILAKAAEKKREQEDKGEEEFQISKLRIVDAEQSKIKGEFARKLKMEQTKQAIKRSMAINKSRLMKIKARQAVIMQIAEHVKVNLTKVIKSNADNHKALCQKLITQGLLMLFEEEVTIRCRTEDLEMVESCLVGAEQDYAAFIDKEAGVRRATSLKVDKSRHLPGPPDGSGRPSCLGGVVLSCQQGLISIDNTLDARLQLVLEQDKPRIRSLLFPAGGR